MQTGTCNQFKSTFDENNNDINDSVSYLTIQYCLWKLNTVNRNVLPNNLYRKMMTEKVKLLQCSKIIDKIKLTMNLVTFHN